MILLEDAVMIKDTELMQYNRRIYYSTTLILFVILLIIINMAGLFAGDFFYNEFCVLNTRTDLARFRSLQAELDEGRRTKNWQDVSIDSRLGYVLRGTYLPNPIPSDKTVIFVHGITANRLMGLWYANIYLNQGFNVLIYDSRGHGESGGPSTTWGYYEKYDLDQWVDWVEQQHPHGTIGIHGVSMGAATALEHAKMNEATKRVTFYVADSAYADLEDLLTQQINTAVPHHNPFWVKLLLKYSSVAAYADSHFWYAQVSPLRSVRAVSTPILYLHGESDKLVPVQMCYQLYAATKGYKEIHVFPNSGHAMAIFEHKAEYNRIVTKFIETAGQLN